MQALWPAAGLALEVRTSTQILWPSEPCALCPFLSWPFCRLHLPCVLNCRGVSLVFHFLSICEISVRSQVSTDVSTIVTIVSLVSAVSVSVISVVSVVSLVCPTVDISCLSSVSSIMLYGVCSLSPSLQ
jgi:hypothetical protein